MTELVNGAFTASEPQVHRVGNFNSIDYKLNPIPDFNLEEMACNCGCGLVILNPELLFHIGWARKIYTWPIFVNSWTRCKAWNKGVHGKRKSYHLWGKAVDIRPAQGWKVDGEFLDACQETFPFTKLYPTFVHCDIRGPRCL